jgi:hypothetical protein
MGDIPLGLALNAEFLLAIVSKPRIIFGLGGDPERNWLRAVEWAHQNGANIIIASVGYGANYLPEDMDGQASLVAKAVKFAADKGILVVNSAGNHRPNNNRWSVISTPADVDNVLTVGGIDPKTEVRSRFSSFGPSADGRKKPNVSANSTTVVARMARRDTFRIVSGTSFAAPLVAGFAACIWQAKSHLNAAEIFELIEQSAELYPHYDYAHGYGVPNARFLEENRQKPTKHFEFVEDKDAIKIEISEEFFPFLERSIILRLYYHLKKQDGKIAEYAVIDVFQKNPLTFSKEKLEGIIHISVHFLGYTETYEIY